MKTLITIVAFVATFFFAGTVNAQNYSSPVEAYNYCRIYMHNGDDAYSGGCFEEAQSFYEKALECNMECPDKKYITNKRIYKKIGDCKYAISHNGKTRQQANAETVGAILGIATAVGAVATVASHSHHDVVEVHHFGPHHEPHHHHHFPF